MEFGKLSIGDFGDDVARLHKTLTSQGFEASPEEVKRKFFGPSTREAVGKFQKAQGIDPSCEVCEKTAAMLSSLPAAGSAVSPAVDAQGKEIPPSTQSAVTLSTTRPPIDVSRVPIDVITQPVPLPRPQPVRFLVYGQVHQSNDAPVTGVTVGAFHQSPDSTMDLGQAITNSDGGYQIPYQFQPSPGSQGGPNLMMQVLNAQGQLLANPPVVNNASREQRIDIVVSISEPETPFIVQGIIRLLDGTPIPNLEVKASDKDLRREQELGTTTTNSDGYYRITYTREQFSRAEKQTADLIVRAFYNDPTGIVPIVRLLATSDVLYNAPPVATIDLTVGGEYRGKSEYERYIAEITPLLQDIPLAALREDEKEDAAQGQFQDITFLTNETGINPEHLAFLVLAARLEQQTRSETASFNLEAAVFYGWFRQNLPTNLPALLSQNPTILRRTLSIAIEENIIPYRLKEQLNQILNRLQELIVEWAFQPPAANKSSLADLLRTVIPSESLQRTLFNPLCATPGRY
jgi:peptidoglycan hydrolase-like protein with peptidoglycan-binding domain